MTSSRDHILNKLRSTRRPFPDAPPRPSAYRPVISEIDRAPEALIARFSQELEKLYGQCVVVDDDEGVCGAVLTILAEHQATDVIAWDFRHIPAAGLKEAISARGIATHHPETHDEFREETLEAIRGAQVGLTGAEAAIAATGTLIVRTAPGKGRLPTVLAPAHIAVITLEQLLPTLEDWIAAQRAAGLADIRASANVCFITGPSKTGDIEMTMILGVHGPGKTYVIIRK